MIAGGHVVEQKLLRHLHSKGSQECGKVSQKKHQRVEDQATSLGKIRLLWQERKLTYTLNQLCGRVAYSAELKAQSSGMFIVSLSLQSLLYRSSGYSDVKPQCVNKKTRNSKSLKE